MLLATGLKRWFGIDTVPNIVNLEILSALIEYGANVNFRNEDGQTALFYCVTPRRTFESDLEIPPRTEAIRLLVSHGADPNIIDNKRTTALVLACRINAHFEVVRALLENGADPNFRAAFGLSPLMISSRRDPEYVKLLLEFGANVTDRSDEGKSVLMCAREMPWNPALDGLHHTPAEIESNKVWYSERLSWRKEVIRLIREAGAME